jgi:hypothetical protein
MYSANIPKFVSLIFFRKYDITTNKWLTHE